MWREMPVQDFIKKGDLMLVKGSHSMELNKIVDEITRDPDSVPWYRSASYVNRCLVESLIYLYNLSVSNMPSSSSLV